MKLTTREKRDVKQGHAQVLKCGHCGSNAFYGAMMLISLSISGHKPTCSYECNKAMGQAK